MQSWKSGDLWEKRTFGEEKTVGLGDAPNGNAEESSSLAKTAIFYSSSWSWNRGQKIPMETNGRWKRVGLQNGVAENEDTSGKSTYTLWTAISGMPHCYKISNCVQKLKFQKNSTLKIGIFKQWLLRIFESNIYLPG